MTSAGTMHLFDTTKGAVVPFAPGPDVTMYVCGITPYDATHLGHAFTYLTFDLIIRRLEDRGHHVRMVRNVTDVDDSILPKAKELGMNYLELAAREMAYFDADMTALNMRPAVAEPRATESIQAIINLVKRLEAGGHTYHVEGITFFDVTTLDSFGSLSGYDTSVMEVYAAERGGRRRTHLGLPLWARPARLAH